MSEEQPTTEVTDLGSIEGAEGGPASPSLEGAPVTELKPEDIGSLSLRYVDGVPELVVSGGTGIPLRLAAVQADGTTLAAYAVQAPLTGP